MNFSFPKFLCVSRHSPGHSVFVSHFPPRFSGLSPYSRSYSTHFIFHDFIVSSHIPGLKVCLSHFPRFYCFSLYCRSKSVCVSFFSRFSVFLAILHVLQCALLIFHDFQVSSHIPVPAVFISHFPCFSVFLAILQVLICAFLILKFFSVSRHIQCPTVCVSHFS